MPEVSNASKDAAQNAILSNVTTYYLSLHTADPVGTGASEGTDGRQAITFAASSGGTQASSNAQNWASAVGGQTYSYFGVWTAASAGTYLRGGPLTANITPGAGSQIQVTSGQITFTAT
jgi:hypothetical protein